MVIDRFRLAVCVDLLSQEGKVGDLLFGIPQGISGAGGNGIAPFNQFLIAADAVLGEKVHFGGRPFQILNGRPSLVSGALLGHDIVLNVNGQADLPAALSGLSGGSGASGNPGGNGFFRIIGVQVLSRVKCSWSDALAKIYFPRLILYPSRCNRASKSSRLEDTGISRSMEAFNFAL